VICDFRLYKINRVEIEIVKNKMVEPSERLLDQLVGKSSFYDHDWRRWAGGQN